MLDHYTILLLAKGTSSRLLMDKSKIVGNVGHSKLKTILSLDEAKEIIKPSYISKHNLPSTIARLFEKGNMQFNAS